MGKSVIAPAATRNKPERSRDPTFTLKLRKSFRIVMKTRLRLLRGAIRVAVIQRDALGLTGESHMQFHPPDVRLAGFEGWMKSAATQIASGDWMRPFIERAWNQGATKALAETGFAGPHQTELLVKYAQMEMDGILAATLQQITREAAQLVLMRGHRMRALRRLFRAFDRVAVPRMSMLCDDLVVRSYNRAKIAAYREAGIAQIGVNPEMRIRRGPALQPKHVSDAATEEEFVGVLTAGDDDVCDECEGIAEDAPYEIDEAQDLIPAHPNCRCAFFPWFDLRNAGPELSLEGREDDE